VSEVLYCFVIRFGVNGMLYWVFGGKSMHVYTCRSARWALPTRCGVGHTLVGE